MSKQPSLLRCDDARLARQRANLVRFVDDEKAAFALQRYLPWTDDRGVPECPVRVDASRHISGCLGLYLTKPVKNKGFVCVYPGVLMWEELADKFSMLYHCPTAVRVKGLDYFVDASMAKRMELEAECYDSKTKRWWVRMTLQGDPTAFGPIINSPRETSARANCILESCKANDLKRCLTPVGEKVRVSSTILTLHRVGAMDSLDDELLYAYDATETDVDLLRRTKTNDGLFWYQHDRQLHESPHCEHCFGMKTVVDCPANELYLCSRFVGDVQCPIGRHRRCFESGDQSFARNEWYCSAHRQPLVPIKRSRILTLTPPPSEPVTMLRMEDLHGMIVCCKQLHNKIGEARSIGDPVAACDGAFMVAHELRKTNPLPPPLRVS